MSLEDQYSSAASDRVLSALRHHRMVATTFWWLETVGHDAPTFVYAWVVPARGRDSLEWAHNKPKLRKVAGSKRRLVRSTLASTGEAALGVVGSLCAGMSLREACAHAGADEPPVGGGFRFAPDYAVSPVFYFSSVERRQGRHGLSPEAGCFCQRIATVQPFAPLLHDESEPADLLRWLLDSMEAETGLGFRGAAADAIRAVEVFCLPSFDENERSRVKVLRSPQGDNTCTVRIEDDLAAEYLIQVSAHVLGDRVYDCVVQAVGSPPSAKFKLPSLTDDRIIRVWRRVDLDSPWILWHEEDRYVIREIRTRMNLVGLTGEVKSDWLTRLAGTSAAERAGKYMKIQQVQGMPLVTSSREPWERATASARLEARRLFPDASGGRFFSKGWEGDSRLSLAEWLKEELSKHPGRIIFVDPFFDDPAIDILVRVSGGAKSIAVLTCTQIRSDDDAASAPPRDERIRSACRQLDTVLRGTQISILDLRSEGGGSRSLFHDRYIIVFDDADRPSCGYHLSNSLQGATRTSPLLITPIPVDTLPAVADYVSELLAPPSTAKLEQLYPPKRVPPQRATDIHETVCEQVLAFAATLHRQRDYTAEPCPNPCERLVNLGLVEGGRTRIKWDDDGVAALAEFFEKTDLTESTTVWCGLAESLVRDNTGREGLSKLVHAASGTLGDFLERYLAALPEGRVTAGYLPEDRTATRTLAYLFDQGFLPSLDHASSLCEYFHPLSDNTNPWPLKWGARIFAENWPGRVDGLVAKFSTEAPSAQALLSSIASALVVAIQERCAPLFDLLRAQCQFLRAFAVMSGWYLVRSEDLPEDQLAEALGALNDHEQRQAYARMIYDLRVDTNCRDGDDSSVAKQRARMFHRLLRTFAAGTDVEDVAMLVRLLSGPVPGSAARSTTAEFLRPLVEKGALDVRSVFEIWNSVFHEVVIAATSDYFASRDEDLLETWGSEFWRTTGARRTEVLRHVSEALPKRGGILRQPFLRNRNFDLWYENAKVVLWWLLALNSAETVRPVGAEEPALASTIHALMRLIREECLVEFVVGELAAVAKRVMGAAVPGGRPEESG